MSLSRAAIKNSVFSWMLMASLMVFGWIGFSRLAVSQMPDVDFPVISVSVTYEGAAPEIMETEVVDVLEDALMAVEGIREITSTARQGSATIKIELNLDRDVDVAMQDVQARVSQAARRLPVDIDPPTMSKSNPEDNPIMWIGFSGQGKTRREMTDFAQDYLRPAFQTVPGVGEVTLGGFIERNLRIWVNRTALEKRDLTISDVVEAIGRQHVELPAGRIETPQKEYPIRVMGEAQSVAAFENILITRRGGQPIFQAIRLKDVARVEDGLDDIRRISRINGEPSVGLGIRKQRGSNAVAVAKAIKARMADIQRTLPEGFVLGVNFDSTVFIEESIQALTHEMILAAVLTSLICWLFLGSFGATLNVLLAIPTSLLGTFLVLYFMGFSLNTFTMLGLTLAIGIVVDDAIMVLENITRHREMGKSRWQAALDGAQEISFAAVAATVAVIAIFLPVAFMEGIIGKFFFQFGVAISVAVAISLLEALTLTPMRMSRYGSEGRRGWFLSRVEKGFTVLSRSYHALLKRLLAHSAWVLLGAVVVSGGSIWVLKHVRQEFVPSQDQSRIMIRVMAPIGSALSYTDAHFQKIEAWISKQPEVNRYFAAVGGFGGGDVDTGVLFVTLNPPETRSKSQIEIMQHFRKELNAMGGARVIIVDLSTGGFTAERGFPVEFSIRGPEWAVLGNAAQDVASLMEKSGLYVDIDDDYRVGVPELQVIPNRQKAAARGVDMQSIAMVINAQIAGQRVGKYTKEGRRYDARVRLELSDRSSVKDMLSLRVRNHQGESVALRELVDVKEAPAVQTITRRGRERSVGMFANLAPGVSQTQALAYLEKEASKILPQGCRVVLTGGSKTFQESFQSLIFALVLGIIVSYMVLGSQFNSFVHPLTVLLALPFSVSGAFVALYLGGYSLSIYSMIGILLLMGIVKKNSILLVEFTNEVRNRGLGVTEALLEACPIRLRPIVMTSLATISAAIPTALSRGAGSETRVPMAVVVIGGVLVSTLFTLIVVPCAYQLFSHLEQRRSEDRGVSETL